MSPQMNERAFITPAAFWSHGSPLMCCKDSESSEYWAKFGKAARENGIKGLVFVGAHWEELDDRIRVATKTKPGVVQMDMVPRSYWENYPVNVSLELAGRVVDLLRTAGFPDVQEDPTFDWHDDTITPARWMFPEGTPPATVVSLNARYNPIFHVKIGKALRELRKEGILLCGTGGAKGRTPAQWAIEFEKSGARLAGALTRLTHSLRYKDAHPTDDHFYPLLVIGGSVIEDEEYGRKMAQTWELQHMCNNQFVWGSWESVSRTQKV
ncbi:aromatic ring-opening dioxygenase [Ilyonectria sp. MPI-CAGE-AT-0026]|nr:aromatic ring-opening dioxygenase [Ilyonectria sp. MPI-CAGE-AT-0026]